MSREKHVRPYGFCYVCAQAVSVNIHGGATQHGSVANDRLCPGSEIGMDLTIEARDARIRRDAAADAWDAGARWAFEEITGEPEKRFGLAPGDNPHRKEPAE